jgi:glycosyltransferase involved in cell wall biosynthesis
MKVSIITVTYNSEKYLKDCIDSVVRQQYADIEYIIVDGGSSDNTINIIKSYGNKISRWISEQDGGMYDAINKGIGLATGDVIGWLNSDDMLFDDQTISDIVKSFNEKKVDSVYGDLVYVDPTETRKVLRYWKGKIYDRSRFLFGWMPAHPTYYVRREIIQQLGNYKTHYYTACDYEFMARYLYKHRISAYYLPKLIVRMRNGGQSNSSITRHLRANRRDYLAMKRNEIPSPLVVSVLKPLRKLPQFYNSIVPRFL